MPRLQHDDGWIPLVAANSWVMESNGLSQAPTLAFGTWQTYRSDPQPDLLIEMYDSLRRNIDWWYANRQPRHDGAFGFHHGQEGGGDDHPRADELSGLFAAAGQLPRPMPCGFILMEMQCLARMAEVLDRR